LAFLGLAVSINTAIGLFIPQSNPYLMQKIVVFFYLLFIFWLDYGLLSYSRQISK
jgi:hypothetical protein